MTRYIGAVTTPEAVAQQLALADPSAPLTPAGAEWAAFVGYARELCWQVSNALFLQTSRVFVPYRATRTYYAQDAYYESRFTRRWFFNDEDGLQIDSVAFGATVLSADEWRALGTNALPYYALRVSTTPASGADFNDALEVVGWWGYSNLTPYQHPRALASVTLTASQNTLSVPDASDFETLEYVRVEDELMQVTARDEVTDVLTLARGVQGTTAVAHTNEPLWRVEVFPSARFAATRLVAWLYQKRNDTGDRVQFGDGTSLVPSSLPAHIANDIRLLKRSSWGVV